MKIHDQQTLEGKEGKTEFRWVVYVTLTKRVPVFTVRTTIYVTY